MWESVADFDFDIDASEKQKAAIERIKTLVEIPLNKRPYNFVSQLRHAWQELEILRDKESENKDAEKKDESRTIPAFRYGGVMYTTPFEPLGQRKD